MSVEQGSTLVAFSDFCCGFPYLLIHVFTKTVHFRRQNGVRLLKINTAFNFQLKESKSIVSVFRIFLDLNETHMNSQRQWDIAVFRDDQGKKFEGKMVTLTLKEMETLLT